jgi:eukaryotic-like serine/threonine-protein kinase
VALTLGEKLGPYEIVTLVGQGGMGEVYRARDIRLDRTVAIKVLPATFADNPVRLERFEREARAIAGLNHPNICGLFDVGRQDGVDYLVMEFLEGETLDARLKRGPLPFDQTLRYGREIADALDHAHRRGFIHRDLKPANIMLTATGAKLLDFGLAKLRTLESDSEPASARTASLTGDHTLLGTLQYMAPEQLEEKDVDARADIFALGLVLYEMVTGLKAFAGTSHASLIAAILSSEPRPASSIQPTTPPALDHVIRRCLAKDPEDRWQSARDVSRELEWIALQSSHGGRAELPASRTRLLVRSGWIAAGVVLAGAVGLGLLMAANTPSAQPTRTVVRLIEPPLPADATFSESAAFMALSPDGRFIAYIASTAGTAALWVRNLADSSARPLPGTDGARQPFWSPDSRSIAFGAGGKLKRIAIEGGLPQVLCDAPAAYAGTWNRDDVILFAPKDSSTFVRVSASGGAPRPATALDSAREEGAHNWPQFLPDGRHFLYLAVSSRPEFNGIYVGALDSPERRFVLNVRSKARFVAPDQLLYQRDGVLLAQTFDTKRSRLTGEPVQVAQNIAHNLVTGGAAFSVSDTGLLAYRTVGDTELVWFDRTGKHLETLGPPGHLAEPALSPNGTRVAVTVLDQVLGTPDVWVIDTSSGAASRMTFDAAADTRPVWSPDGSHLAFSSNRNGTFGIFQKPSIGAGPDELLYATSWASLVDEWSPDGRVLLLDSMLDSPGTFHLWALGVGDRQAVRLGRTEFIERNGQFSPDGRWIAYTSNVSGAEEVWVRSTSDAAKPKKVSTHGGIEPKWRRDGRELYYIAPDQRLMAAPMAAASDTGFGAPQALFPTRMFGAFTTVTGRNQYDVTADGQRFLMVQPRGGGPITIVVNWTALLKNVRS